MILQDAIERYIAWRRAHGAKFVTSAVLLRGFCAHVGGAVECDAVGEAQTVSYLAGNGPLTRSRANKYGALAGFWRYAIQPRLRDTVAASDRPKVNRAQPTLGHRLTSTLVTSCSACSPPSISAGSVRFSSTVTPCGHCCCFSTARVCGSARHSACRQAGRKTLAAGYGLNLPGKPRWHVIGEKHRSRRVRQATPGGRDREKRRRTAGPVPAFVTTHGGREPADVVVPPGWRCPATAAGALHMARPRPSRRDAGLSVDDTGTAPGGLAALRPLCQRRRPCVIPVRSARGCGGSSSNTSSPSATSRGIPRRATATPSPCCCRSSVPGSASLSTAWPYKTSRRGVYVSSLHLLRRNADARCRPATSA